MDVCILTPTICQSYIHTRPTHTLQLENAYIIYIRLPPPYRPTHTRNGDIVCSSQHGRNHRKLLRHV